MARLLQTALWVESLRRSNMMRLQYLSRTPMRLSRKVLSRRTLFFLNRELSETWMASRRNSIILEPLVQASRQPMSLLVVSMEMRRSSYRSVQVAMSCSMQSSVYFLRKRNTLASNSRQYTVSVRIVLGSSSCSAYSTRITTIWEKGHLSSSSDSMNLYSLGSFWALRLRWQNLSSRSTSSPFAMNSSASFLLAKCSTLLTLVPTTNTRFLKYLVSLMASITEAKLSRTSSSRSSFSTPMVTIRSLKRYRSASSSRQLIIRHLSLCFRRREACRMESPTPCFISRLQVSCLSSSSPRNRSLIERMLPILASRFCSPLLSGCSESSRFSISLKKRPYLQSRWKGLDLKLSMKWLYILESLSSFSRNLCSSLFLLRSSLSSQSPELQASLFQLQILKNQMQGRKQFEILLFWGSNRSSIPAMAGRITVSCSYRIFQMFENISLPSSRLTRHSYYIGFLTFQTNSRSFLTYSSSVSRSYRTFLRSFSFRFYCCSSLFYYSSLARYISLNCSYSLAQFGCSRVEEVEGGQAWLPQMPNQHFCQGFGQDSLVLVSAQFGRSKVGEVEGGISSLPHSIFYQRLGQGFGQAPVVLVSVYSGCPSVGAVKGGYAYQLPLVFYQLLGQEFGQASVYSLDAIILGDYSLGLSFS